MAPSGAACIAFVSSASGVQLAFWAVASGGATQMSKASKAIEPIFTFTSPSLGKVRYGSKTDVPTDANSTFALLDQKSDRVIGIYNNLTC